VDALVLGGSGEFDFDGDRSADDPARTISATFLNRLTPLLEQVFAQDVPTFGICYGHQLIGAFSGVSVVYSEKEKKSCSHEVYLNDEQERGPLLHGIPEQFHANYGHKDVLETIPDGATLLMAGGDLCTVSALRYKQNIYTVQFHPELTLEDTKVRLAESPSYLPEGAAVEDLYRSTPHANQLLQNFGALLASRAVER
jgi:GMP synthase (glutamine-hydrolysing)